MTKLVSINFNTEKEELSIIIDNEELIIDGFLKDATGKIHVSVLSKRGQELLIKKLVNNISLN